MSTLVECEDEHRIKILVFRLFILTKLHSASVTCIRELVRTTRGLDYVNIWTKFRWIGLVQGV